MSYFGSIIPRDGAQFVVQPICHLCQLRHFRIGDQLAAAADEFRESMPKDVDMAKLYRRARRVALRHIDDAPSVPLPDACPWTLDELLVEGRTA